MMTHYQTLNVNRACTRDEIRSAYILMAKAAHPDLVAKATDRFVQVHEAYKTLGNPKLKAQYDAWLDDNYTLCSVCKGRGVTIKQKTIRERLMRPCTACSGSGVIQ